MIKAVIFDFFGVICSDEYWRYMRQDKATEDVFNKYAQEVNAGDISWHEFVQKVAETKGLSSEEVDKMYETSQIDPRLVGYIHELKKKYKVALLTNAHHEFIDDLLKEHHLDTLFDVVVVSSRVGVIKPDPRIYEIALEELGVEAPEAIFTDDIARNTDAAFELGINAVHYQEFAQLKEAVAMISSQSE